MTAEDAFKLVPLGHALCAYMELGGSPSRVVGVMMATYGAPVTIRACPYLEAQRLVREINDLIAMHNKMKGG